MFMNRKYAVYLTALTAVFLIVCTRYSWITSASEKTSVLRENRTTHDEERVISRRLAGSDGLVWLRESDQVRHCVTGHILGTVPGGVAVEPFSVSGGVAGPEEKPDAREKSFQTVFQRKAWGATASGPGSTLNFAQESMAILHSVISQIRALTGKDKVTMLDIPCGDMQWMHRLLQTRDDVLYTGMDIVPEIIAGHQKTFGHLPNRKFVHQDIVKAQNVSAYDLVFSRMMMQHLYTRDVLTMLDKLSKSGSRYLLMTTFAHLPSNADLPVTKGVRFRQLNMELPPFRLPPPSCLARDGPPDHPEHSMALWKLPLTQVTGCSSGKRTKQNQYACVPWS